MDQKGPPLATQHNLDYSVHTTNVHNCSFSESRTCLIWWWISATLTMLGATAKFHGKRMTRASSCSPDAWAHQDWVKTSPYPGGNSKSMKEQEIHEMLPLPRSNNNVMITVCTVHMSILRVWAHLLLFKKRVDESQIQGLVANSLYMVQVGTCR